MKQRTYQQKKTQALNAFICHTEKTQYTQNGFTCPATQLQLRALYKMYPSRVQELQIYSSGTAPYLKWKHIAAADVCIFIATEISFNKY
jgi:hypothetical protein